MRVFHQQPCIFWDDNFLELCHEELEQGEKYGIFLCVFILITSLIFYCCFELSRFLLLMCLKDLFVIFMTFVNYCSVLYFLHHCFSFSKGAYFLLLTTSVLLLICSKLPFASVVFFFFPFCKVMFMCLQLNMLKCCLQKL